MSNYTTINKSTDYFNTVLYTGNGSNNHTITGVGFNTDLAWIKNRGGDDHRLFNQVAGINKFLKSNSTASETTDAILTTNSDGYVVTNAGEVNANNGNFVGWNWKANGAGSTNYDGSITSTVSANQTAGFSIVSYTGSTGNNTVGHGLSSAPKVVMVKTRDNARNWVVYHQGMGAGNWIYLNQNYAQSPDVNYWNNTNPTNSVFSISNTNYPENNGNGENYIAYCFAEKKGYSKFGSYTGNGSSDGSYIHLGFKPAWFMVKRTNASGNPWIINDNKRDPFNFCRKNLFANASDAEVDVTSESGTWDLLSNGVKMRNSGTSLNGSGSSYIYMAFGQSLVGSNNVPCTAR